MFGVILKAPNSSFQKGLTFCCSINVKKVMKLLAFIFEQPSNCPPLPIMYLTWQIAQTLMRRHVMLPFLIVCIMH